MLIKIANNPRNYAWGSRTLISDYFGTELAGSNSSEPMAEIWFGTHSGSPSFLADDKSTTLLTKLQNHELGFLLKILAADQPLSIQAHPNKEQAEKGFAKENSLGVALSAANRNYKDNQHKPEIIVALSEFEALCGFKSLAQIDALLEDMQIHDGLSEGFRNTAASWRELLKQNDGLQKLFSDILNRRANFDGFAAELTTMADFDARFSLAEKLNLIYPGDPGVMIAMMMNHFFLEPGQALFLPAGNIHAYLSGLGVEVMASSDNVLRGGLTAKHVDIEELEKVVDFNAGPVSFVETKELTSGLIQYQFDTDAFLLYRAEPNGLRMMTDLKLQGEAIFLCTAGEISVSNSLDEHLILRRGEAAYMSADANFFSVSGSGTAFLATSGL